MCAHCCVHVSEWLRICVQVRVRMAVCMCALYARVHMAAYISACTCMCTHCIACRFAYGCVHVYLNVCLWLRVCMSMCAYDRVCVPACVRVASMHVCSNVCVWLRMYTCMYPYDCVYLCVGTSVATYTAAYL